MTATTRVEVELDHRQFLDLLLDNDHLLVLLAKSVHEDGARLLQSQRGRLELALLVVRGPQTDQVLAHLGRVGAEPVRTRRAPPM